MLTLVDPWIAYGYPSLKTVRELIYKRGHGKVNRMRLPLSDNNIIANELNAKGETGISCIEDLIHEIVTCGPHFKKANNFLWPMKLSNPKGGFELKRHQYGQGYGATGNREEYINNLVAKMM